VAIYSEQVKNGLHPFDYQCFMLTDKVIKTMQNCSLTHGNLAKRGVVGWTFVAVNERFMGKNAFETIS